MASKETGLYVNAEKSKYMVMSRDQNSGQNQNTEMGNSNKSFVMVEHFVHLETTLPGQNSINKEIKDN